MKLDHPSKEETQPPDQQAFSSFANLSETFYCKNGRDSILQGSSEKLNGNTFEFPRFQSLRWKTKRDLKLLSQRYTQNQEDWKIPSHTNHSESNNVPQNSESVVSTNGVERPTNTFEETSVDPAFEDHANKSQGLLTTSTDSNYEVYSFSRSKTVQSNPEKRFTERNVELPSHRNTNYLDKSSRLDDDNNLDYSPHLDSSSSQFHETHFDSNHINDSSDVLSPRSSRDRQSWTENDDNSSVSDGQSKTRKKMVNESKKDFEDESYFDEHLSAGDSFARGGSRRTSKQQAGFRGAVHGLLARIGKKLNKNDTSKMTKDEKIIAIMLQKKKDEEREEREREEAHARWEAEREELQRNSATRRSIDPSVFRRRNSLGGSIGSSRRENSKSRILLNAEKQAERKKQHELQLEEQKIQIQAKLESDFQRANSLRASISQQNLLRAKLKNLHMEQKQQQISQQKRKSMENLSQLKKQLESKHIIVEQKLENMRKEQKKSSRDDLRSKTEQSKLRIQQMNEELAQYQAELQEFNDKQLQHADYLMRRAQLERKEAARRERLEREQCLLDNKRRIQEEEERKLLEKEEMLKEKERKREQLIREKLEFQAKSRAAARFSQLLREEIRNSDDFTLTAKRLAALQDRSFTSKRSSDTDSLSSAVTSPVCMTFTQDVREPKNPH